MNISFLLICVYPFCMGLLYMAFCPMKNGFISICYILCAGFPHISLPFPFIHSILYYSSFLNQSVLFLLSFHIHTWNLRYTNQRKHYFGNLVIVLTFSNIKSIHNDQKTKEQIQVVSAAAPPSLMGNKLSAASS